MNARDAPSPVDPSVPARVKAAAALILTGCAGLVDLVGYLGVYHVFTAHLTGTTVQLGEHIAAGDGRAVGLSATVVAAYAAGSVAGRTVIEVCARHQVRKAASLTLTLEAIVLAAVALFAPRRHADLGAELAVLAALAFAMGLQTATLTRVGPLTVHTTFVTGMLNKLAQIVSHMLFRLYDRARSPSPPDEANRGAMRRDARSAALLASIWTSYVVGGIAGALAYARWSMSAMYAADLLLLLPIAADQLWGLSVQEEKEQMER